jgi:hypothetical protein
VAFGAFNVSDTSTMAVSTSVIVNNSIVLTNYSYMAVTANTTQKAVIPIVATSSMAVNARLKWEDENDTAESWSTISDNSETWTPVSDQSETWTAISDSSETWSPIADNSESWQIAA